MSAFFDTNVLVYLVDASEPPKQAIAVELISSHLRERSLVISTQVLQELYVIISRRHLLDPQDAADMIATLAQERVVPSSAGFVVRSVGLATRYGISLWDALVVQAAIESECTVLFSEDLQDGMRFGELRVVNPFALRAHEPPGTASSRKSLRPPSRRAAR